MRGSGVGGWGVGLSIPPPLGKLKYHSDPPPSPTEKFSGSALVCTFMTISPVENKTIILRRFCNILLTYQYNTPPLTSTVTKEVLAKPLISILEMT